MSRSYNIIDAAKDLVTGKLEFVSDEVAKERMDICKQCDARNDTINVCTVCGCFLPAKVKLKESSCPMEAWAAVDD